LAILAVVAALVAAWQCGTSPSAVYARVEVRANAAQMIRYELL
jgi:hypothetical protein